MNIPVVYAAAAILSLILLLCYWCIVKKKDGWFVLLLVSVLVVNIGYFTLSISNSLSEALLANRIAYLGSVFLPMSIMMIILNVTQYQYKRWLPILLLIVSIAIFFVAASPGYLDIYYREVTFAVVDGVSTLQKVYGAWHLMYAVYLVSYFIAMIVRVVYAILRHRLQSTVQVVALLAAVFVNLGVWFVEQKVDLDLEFLSISYIISVVFLLVLHPLLEENRRLKSLVIEHQQELSKAAEEISQAKVLTEQMKTAALEEMPSVDRKERFLEGLLELTPTEKEIYNAYIARVTTKEIMAALNIKENTLKFHNKNLYQKLGVSSRKELQEIYKQIKASE